MRWVLFGVCAVVFVASWALGYAVGRRDAPSGEGEEAPDGRGPAGAAGRDGGGRARLSIVVVGVCLVFLAVRTVFRYFPSVEMALLPYDAYAVIRPWWAIPFGLIPIGVGVRHMSTPFARKGVAVIGLGLLLVCGQRLLITALFDPAELTGEVRADGVCQQTTGYTCGAAAAATLLERYGIAADEREMAERCWTNALTGTDELCVARGLRQKLADRDLRPVLRDPSWAELAARDEPAMVTIYWGFLIDHWVVVDDAAPEDDVVRVADPLRGNRLLSVEEFRELWRGSVVAIEPSGGG